MKKLFSFWLLFLTIYISAQSASVRIDKMRINNSDFTSSGFNFTPINGINNFNIDYTVKGDKRGYAYAIVEVNLYINGLFYGNSFPFNISDTNEVQRNFSFSLNKESIKSINQFKIEIAYRTDVLPHTGTIKKSVTWIGNASNISNPEPGLPNGSGSCSNAPTGLNQTSIGNTHTFSWNNVTGTMPYTIAIRIKNGNWNFFTTNSNSFTQLLNPSTEYEWAVRANCKLWSEQKSIQTYNKCDENVTIDNSHSNYMNFQANNVLTVTNSTLRNSNARGSKAIVKNSKILPKTRIYVQGCYGNKNENSIDDITYSDIQSEISDSTTIINNIIPTSTFKTTTQNDFTISPNPT
ncbi:hypothetical protein ACNFNZ_16795, partial [Empedobacter brevis]